MKNLNNNNEGSGLTDDQDLIQNYESYDNIYRESYNIPKAYQDYINKNTNINKEKNLEETLRGVVEAN